MGKCTFVFIVSDNSLLSGYPVSGRDYKGKKEQRDWGKPAKYFICYAKDFVFYSLRDKMALKLFN